MGATEVIFIFAVYLLLFGAKGIPSLARSMGQAVRTFRNATEDIQREIWPTIGTPQVRVEERRRSRNGRTCRM